MRLYVFPIVGDSKRTYFEETKAAAGALHVAISLEYHSKLIKSENKRIASRQRKE